MSKVLILGSGAREHALAWKLVGSTKVDQIIVASGNGGIQTFNPDKVKTEPSLNENTAVEDIVKYAQEKKINLVFPGSEATLVSGISDACKQAGIKCFGPSKYAAQIEGSKAFSKAFMREHKIPTADYKVFERIDEAKDFIKSMGNKKIVIKASGPAQGKGVIIAESQEEAKKALEEIMVKRVFGRSGEKIVIEEFIEGEEVSVLAFSDGYTVSVMPPAQDYKKLENNDKGPNTGGMGAFAPSCPASVVHKRDRFFADIKKNVLQKTIDGLRKSGNPFIGVLYAGIIVTKEGDPYVLEFNARFGDPECQALLPLMQSDLYDVLVACCDGYLDGIDVVFDQNQSSCCVVMCHSDYATEKQGSPCVLTKSQGFGQIRSDSMCFAGKIDYDEQKKLYSVGKGRGLSIVTRSACPAACIASTYELTSLYEFENRKFRTDIGQRSLKGLMESISYFDAGVSIDAGNQMVEKIRKAVASTKRPGSDAIIGGFAGTFDLKTAGYLDSETLLIGSTDGVGTKILVAVACNKHDTIGQDLVAMSVNDIIVTGAEPLFFLDYFACSKLDLNVSVQVVESIAKACSMANCALIGGETAEMPGIYARGEYDLAGFAVGAVRRGEMLPKCQEMKEGDVIYAFLSSGVHSNGFSLVRKLIERNGLNFSMPVPFESCHKTLGEALLEPTRIYVAEILELRHLIKGAAHITGGGLVENIPRILPNNLAAELDGSAWPKNPVFKWIQDMGKIDSKEMLRTFNCGIGMVVIADKKQETKISQVPGLIKIGTLVSCKQNEEKVKIKNLLKIFGI